jgi:hypothetical protein
LVAGGKNSPFLSTAGREGKDERQTKGEGWDGKLGKGSGKDRNLLYLGEIGIVLHLSEEGTRT